MNREKQIEEMAKILIDYKNKNHIMASTAILADYAEELYNAGYRKQSEGEWIDKHCSHCGEELLFTQGGNAFATTFRQYKTKYCHNCGAKMKGGEDNA